MKLIIKEYLASLKERGELDAILPDLLSQMGLNVYSRPGRGTRQYGVDVAAVGDLDGKGEKVYLFSIKAGHLTRKDWDGDSEQALRPSLNEILDAYIPNCLPVEHRGKDIVICITLGGEIQEQVRNQLVGFLSQNAPAYVTFLEWNGDKIAEYLVQHFMKEDLLPESARSDFRKSLAMLDEPEVSYRHYIALLGSLTGDKLSNDKKRVMAIRQIAICLWILFAWSRTAGNMESAYRASETSLLYAWELLKRYAGKKTKTARSMNSGFMSIFIAYQSIASEFLKENVLPHVDVPDGLATAVRGSTSLDVNLKLFDVLGRIAMDGLWAYWGATRCTEEEASERDAMLLEASARANALKEFISSNTVLLLPAKDDHAIDIFLATLLLATESGNADFIRSWLDHMMDRASFTYKSNGAYPSVFRSYPELLAHPKSADSDYRESATAGSILYPFIAFWAAIFGDSGTFEKVKRMKQDCLPHCTFQIWYPDDLSEANFYTNNEAHGATLTDLDLTVGINEFLERVFGECERSPEFMELTAVKYGWWPIILVACRHYRLPPPLHLARDLWQREADTGNPDEIES